jgi:nicotinic acid phosphoribosyltransferase
MPESSNTTEYNASYDWLSNLDPVFAAQQSWENGTYSQMQTAHLRFQSDGDFADGDMRLLEEYIRSFKIDTNTIIRLGQVTDSMGRSLFRESFLNHLQRLQFSVQVNAAPEATVLPAGEHVLMVQGPALQIL